MSEPNTAGAKPSPSRSSAALIAGIIVLLALLVWFLNPRQPNYKPAPLQPPSPECLKPGRDFVPSNLVAISDQSLDALSSEEKNRAIFRLNTMPCSCGCQLSVAFCRGSNPLCETSRQMVSKIASESGKKPENKSVKK